MDVNLSKLWERQWRTEEPGVVQSMRSQRLRTQLSDRTITTQIKVYVQMFTTVLVATVKN